MEKIFKTAFLSLAFLCLLGIGANLQAWVITVSPAAFTPRDSSAAFNVPWIADHTGLFIDGPVGFGAMFMAPLNLPNGKTIKKITIYYSDEIGGGPYNYFDFYFYRVNVSTGVPEVVAQTTVGDLPEASGRQKIVLTGSQLKFKTVNNNSYGYAICAQFPADCNWYVQLHEIVINY